MADVLVVVLLVAASDLADPATSALTESAEQALEGRGLVIVRGASADELADASASKLGDVLHADAVAVVTWSQPDRREARVHVYDATVAEWRDRTLAFGAGDPAAERGRMLGFQVAAMVPSRVERPPPPPPRIEEPSRPEPRQYVSVELGGVSCLVVDGEGGGFGGMLAARVGLTSGPFIRFSGSFSAGSIDSARAHSTALRAGVGVGSHLIELGRDERSFVGARLELVAIRHAASSVDNASNGARWMPGAEALAEIEWWSARSGGIGLFAAAGPEIAFGTTRVILDGVEVASIPPFRLVGELGVRARF